MYEPAILVVGTRGRSLAGFQGLLPGSVSKYCLQHSPVPVIVVRPSSKRDKARSKRALDPNRHAYKDLLEKSGSSGHLMDADLRNLHTEDSRHPSDDEAAAVAAAIGYKPVTGTPLAQTQLAPTGLDTDAIGVEDPDVAAALMKSPELQNLDSPDISDSSSSNSDEGGTSMSAATTTTTLVGSGGESSEEVGRIADGAASGLGIQASGESIEKPTTELEMKPAAGTATTSTVSSDEK
jgi:hypothetical protein